MNRDNKQLTMLTVNMSIPLSVRLKKVSQELGINILSKKTSELSNDINKEKRLVLLLDCNKNFNERISLCKKIRNSSSMPIILIADFSDAYRLC
ncbi:hypothetical protein ACQLQX_005703 [Klebsiella pneumoniae]